MAEYIDRQAAIEIASGYCHPANIAAELAKLPAADVRPVVLCRDCKHSAVDLENMRYCKRVTYYNHVQDDWFCADGEKREERFSPLDMRRASDEMLGM